MKCFVDPRSNGFLGLCFNYKISNESEFLKLWEEFAGEQ